MSAVLLKVVFFDLGNTLITPQREFVPGARDTLTQLQKRGVRLGLISNTGNLSRAGVLELLPPDFEIERFEENLLIFSSEIHIEKPSPLIFQRALERAGTNPSECLFCTENFPDTLVAQRAGMHAARVLSPPDSDIGSLVQGLLVAALL